MTVNLPSIVIVIALAGTGANFSRASSDAEALANYRAGETMSANFSRASSDG